jgi:hypothetical protein
MILLGTGVMFGLLNKIYACLTDPEYGPSLAPEKSIFMYNVKDEGVKNYFDYLKNNVRRSVVYDLQFYLMASSLVWSRLVYCHLWECQAHTGDSFQAVCIRDGRFV